jgi:hypothetical protein
MVHVHGAQAQQLAQATPGVDPAELVAVPVDVAKHAAMALVCDFTGELLARPFEFPMTMAGVRLLVERVQAATRGRMIRLVRVGVEAARHYHQPLVSAGVPPEEWQLVGVNPTQVASQRQLTGRRRLKTDALDLVAISDLLRAGHGAGHRVLASALGELAGWVAHRERRVTARTALKNQLLGQVDRAFPGVSGGVSSLFGTKVGRLVPAWVHRPGPAGQPWVAGFQQAPAARGVQVLAPVAERLVAAAQGGHPDRPGPDGPTHHRPRPHPVGRLRRPDRRGRQAPGRPAATHPLRRAVERPWLASGPGCQLWGRGRRPGTVAQRPPGVSGQRTVPSNLRLGWPSP